MRNSKRPGELRKFFRLLRAGIKADMDFFSAEKLGGWTKNVNKYLILTVILGAGLFLLGWIADALIKVLSPLGLGHLAITMMMLIASVLALISSVRKSQAVLFDSRDNDTLLAMPIAKRTIFAVRVMRMILFQMGLTAFLLLPAIVMYGIRITPGVGFYFLALAMILILPLLPMAVGVGAGYLIRVIAAKFPKVQKLLTFSLTMLMVLCCAGISFWITQSGRQTADESQMAAALAEISGKLGGYYYPVRVFMNALTDFDVVQFLILVGVSVAPVVVLILLGDRTYYKTLSRMKNRKVVQGGAYIPKRRGKMRALLHHELRRYFATPNYFLNTFVVLTMQVIATILIVINRESLIDGTNGVLAMYGLDQATLLEKLPLATTMVTLLVALVSVMAPTLACGLSIEGHKLDTLKALPMRAWEWCVGKLLMVFVVFALPATSCVAVIGLALSLPALNVLFLCITAGAAVMFANIFGLLMNFRFPKLNWKNEAEAIKQGASLLISILVGCLVEVVMIVLALEFFMTELEIVCAEAAMLMVVLVVVCGIALKYYAGKRYKEIAV